MARLRFRRRRRQSNSTLLLLALGAVTGLALGVVLAERTGGMDGLKDRLSRRGKRRNAGAATAPDDANHSDEHASDDLPMIAVPALANTGYIDTHSGEVVGAALPTDDGVDDTELEARVLEAFRNDPTLRGRAIDIGAIGDGIIELTGWVHSPAEVGHALTLARGVPGVAHVMDRLTIRGADVTRVGPAASDR